MSEVSDKLNIRLLIGKQPHSVAIPRDQEEVFRAAAKYINERLSRYESAYPMLGMEKYMSLVLLDLAVKMLKSEKKQDTLPFMDTLRELTNEIEAAGIK